MATLVLATLALGCGDDGPWYDTAPDPDLSYLPLGGSAFDEYELGFAHTSGRDVLYDAYVPEAGAAPIAIFLPGAYATKDRYRWVGATLASHGVATFIVQPHTDFGNSSHTLELYDALIAENGAPESPLAGKLDPERLVLGGHSAGGVTQAGLTDVRTCSPGFCVDGAATPPALRGLILLSYHNQNTLEDDEPMPAVEAPWLLVAGTLDGLATPEKIDVTFDRLQDRPIYRVDVVGANHFQMTEYVDPEGDLRLGDDLEPTISSKDARAAAAEYIARFARRHLLGEETADDIGAPADDRVQADVRLPRVARPRGHGLPRVMSEPFGDAGLDGSGANSDITASAVFQGARYFLVRNQEEGAEIWRMSDDGQLEQVSFGGGVMNGFYGNPRLAGLLGDMVVWNGELYVGISSGFQGARLDGTSAEVWAYDGASWRPVVSNLVDADPEITIVATAGCEDDDGDPTATITFAGTSFEPGALAGAVVDDIGAHEQEDDPRILWIVDNTEDSLVVQADDVALQDEFTTCEGLSVGDTLFVRQGADENGFGQPWNKVISSMVVFDDRLWIGSGFNYPYGAEVYVSNDAGGFDVAVPRAFLGYHDDGSPITTSVSTMYVSDVTGEEILYVGGTGTQDYGARLWQVGADGSYQMLVDDAIDDDDEGVDEAGIGSDNHQIASLLQWQGRLWVSAMNFSGLQIYSTTDPADPAAWRTEIGDGAKLPRGWGDDAQLAARLFAIGDELWIGSVAFVQLKAELSDKSGLAWRTVDGDTWQLVTGHAFGVNAVQVSSLFELGGTLYAVASSGALAGRQSFGPLQMYVLDDSAGAAD